MAAIGRKKNNWKKVLLKYGDMGECGHWNSSGPFSVDYIYLYSCTFHGYEIISTLLFIGWVIFLANLLGNTASNYFSPTLSSICTKLKVPYDVAGITFLAFGNGSPDIFSQLSSFSGGGTNVLIGIGSLLGGSMFVSTIVVGTISMVAPCKLNSRIFVRDIVFHIVAISTLAFMAAHGNITLLFPFCLCCIYIIYFVVVVSFPWIKRQLASKLGVDIFPNEIPMTNVDVTGSGNQLQTAFWLKDSSNIDIITKSSNSNNSSGISSNNDAAGGYKFLILDDNIEFGDIENCSDELSDNTINLTGLLAPSFSGKIIDDYFGQEGDNHGMEVQSSLNASLLPPKQPTKLHNYAPLINSGDENSSMENNPSKQRSNTNNASRYQSVIYSMYWQQVLIRRKVERSFLSSQWWNYPIHFKVLAILELPFILARDFSIPRIDLESWSKPHAILQPLCAIFLVLFLMGDFSRKGHGSSIFMALIIGVVAMISIFLFTHYNRPPTNPVFITFWIMCAFVMCIVWIYMLAEELVACLVDIGTIYNIAPAYLGLTVLAWGNSMGDFFSNTAVARQGLGEMAIAGCYGGPVFNILIGLSISLTYACSQSYPAPFRIKLDVSAVVSIVFLFISLLSTLVLVVKRDYVLDKQLGLYLIGLYIAYTVVQFGLLVFGVDD